MTRIMTGIFSFFVIAFSGSQTGHYQLLIYNLGYRTINRNKKKMSNWRGCDISTESHKFQEIDILILIKRSRKNTLSDCEWSAHKSIMMGWDENWKQVKRKRRLNSEGSVLFKNTSLFSFNKNWTRTHSIHWAPCDILNIIETSK